ncbi:MAG: hypothetical protein FWD99_03720 [Oscillospiraceae bacterium]|nr:hypothetical protein [Oscillospiraceae bacterium]
MKNKTSKILVDICMTIFLILSFLRWEESNFLFHAIVGTVCTLFFALHICIHRKWLKIVTKSFLEGKIKKSIRWKYAVDILLIAIWGTSITTGFLAIGYFSAGIESMVVFSRLHGITARVGVALVVIHVVQHLPQIRSYLKGKKEIPAE